MRISGGSGWFGRGFALVVDFMGKIKSQEVAIEICYSSFADFLSLDGGNVNSRGGPWASTGSSVDTGQDEEGHRRPGGPSVTGVYQACGLIHRQDDDPSLSLFNIWIGASQRGIV